MRKQRPRTCSAWNRTAQGSQSRVSAEFLNSLSENSPPRLKQELLCFGTSSDAGHQTRGLSRGASHLFCETAFHFKGQELKLSELTNAQGHRATGASGQKPAGVCFADRTVTRGLLLPLHTPQKSSLRERQVCVWALLVSNVLFLDLGGSYRGIYFVIAL